MKCVCVGIVRAGIHTLSHAAHQVVLCGMASSAAERLRAVLTDAKRERRCLLMPACHDAMSAVLIQRAGFEVAFMSGYAVSATSLALPDAGLISYEEQASIGRKICDATRGGLLVIGDGDTGFGGASNVRRTIRGYASCGFAGISIEDRASTGFEPALCPVPLCSSSSADPARDRIPSLQRSSQSVAASRKASPSRHATPPSSVSAQR